MPRVAKHISEIPNNPPVINTDKLLSDAAISEFVDCYLELKDDCDKLKEGLAKYKKAKKQIVN